MLSQWTSDRNAEKRAWERNKKNLIFDEHFDFFFVVDGDRLHKWVKYSPNCFSDRPCGIMTFKYVTGKPLYRWMFGDETNVAMISRMKCTEGHILQRIEVVDARLLFVLSFLVYKWKGYKKEFVFYEFGAQVVERISLYQKITTCRTKSNVSTNLSCRPIHHSQPLVRYFQYTWLSIRCRLTVLAYDFSHSLTHHTRSLMCHCLHRSQIAQQVPFLFHLLWRRIKVIVVQINGISWRKYALLTGSKIHSLTPQIVGFFLHVDRIADLDVNFVMMSRYEFV